MYRELHVSFKGEPGDALDVKIKKIFTRNKCLTIGRGTKVPEFVRDVQVRIHDQYVEKISRLLEEAGVDPEDIEIYDYVPGDCSKNSSYLGYEILGVDPQTNERTVAYIGFATKERYNRLVEEGVFPKQQTKN